MSSGERGGRGRDNGAVPRGALRARVVAELRRVRPVPRSRLNRGTVVWARIPFADEAGSKTRPCVVTRVEGRDVHVLPVTSSTKDSVRQSPLYVVLEDWEAAGLSRPCLVTKREVVIDIIDVATVAGDLTAADAGRVFER